MLPFLDHLIYAIRIFLFVFLDVQSVVLPQFVAVVVVKVVLVFLVLVWLVLVRLRLRLRLRFGLLLFLTRPAAPSTSHSSVAA